MFIHTMMLNLLNVFFIVILIIQFIIIYTINYKISGNKVAHGKHKTIDIKVNSDVNNIARTMMQIKKQKVKNPSSMGYKLKQYYHK